MTAASVQVFIPLTLGFLPRTSIMAWATISWSSSCPRATKGSRSSWTTISALNPGSDLAMSAKISSISATRSDRCSPGCVPIWMPTLAKFGNVE
jgi:hypothetical protein